MKKSRFTDSQIIAILKQAEAGTPALSWAENMGLPQLPSLLKIPYDRRRGQF